MIKLTLTAERKLLAVSMENFQINLNGLENVAYKAALKPLGIELEFEAEQAEEEAA